VAGGLKKMQKTENFGNARSQENTGHFQHRAEVHPTDFSKNPGEWSGGA
jgi:hypothetical protein